MNDSKEETWTYLLHVCERLHHAKEQIECLGFWDLTNEQLHLIAAVLKKTSCVHELVLRHSQLTSACSFSFSVLLSVESLEIITNDPIGEVPLMLFRGLSGGARRVKHLTLVDILEDDETAHALEEMIKNNHMLVRLDLSRSKLNGRVVSSLSNGLRQNQTLQSLELSATGIDNAGAEALANSLAKGSLSRLQDLLLGYNRIGDAGAEVLARALVGNALLKNLVLPFNRIGNRGVTALVQALEVNKTLRKLDLEFNRKIGYLGALAIGKSLPHMMGLCDLRLYRTGIDHDVDDWRLPLTTSIASSSLGNHMECDDGESTDARQKRPKDTNWDIRLCHRMRYYLLLNTSHREILQQPNLPMAIWPLILAKAKVLDVLYFFVREKPDLMACRQKVSSATVNPPPTVVHAPYEKR